MTDEECQKVLNAVLLYDLYVTKYIPPSESGLWYGMTKVTLPPPTQAPSQS